MNFIATWGLLKEQDNLHTIDSQGDHKRSLNHFFLLHFVENNFNFLVIGSTRQYRFITYREETMMYTLRITYILTILCHIIYAENLSPSEEVQLESVVRTVETSRIRRSIISRLFREYSSVLTQQLLQAKLVSVSLDKVICVGYQFV